MCQADKRALAGRKGARDGFILPNGNALIAWNNEVKELTRDRETVFHYRLSRQNKEIGTVARLSGGKTLITELGPKPRLLEVDADGEIVTDVPGLIGIGNSIRDSFHPWNAEVRCETRHAPRCLKAGPAGFYHHQHDVHALGRSPP